MRRFRSRTAPPHQPSPGSRPFLLFCGVYCYRKEKESLFASLRWEGLGRDS